MHDARVRRTMMLTPGHRRERLAKAVTLPVDAVIFDLEDGVPPPTKEEARRTVAAALAELDFGGRERLVRVNGVGTRELDADLAKLPIEHIDAIFVPKVESAQMVKEIDARLSALEARAGLERRLELVLTLETPRGVLDALAIAEASTRTSALFFGSGDYSAQTGGRVTATALHMPRSMVVAAAGAVGCQAIDAAYFAAVKDPDATRADALAARELGFCGKVVFHPNQVAVVNEVFTPTAEEVARAEKIVSAYREALARGDGVTTVDGEFVAIDIALLMERVLKVAAHAGVHARK